MQKDSITVLVIDEDQGRDKRTQEFGTHWKERESVLTLSLACIGIALGIPATLALTRLFRSQLFGLTEADPLTFGVAVLLIGAVMLLSAFFPARRLARVDTSPHFVK